MDLKTKKADHKALDQLRKSRGWAIIRERMDVEMAAAMRALASAPQMDLGEVHYRRGALFAALQLVSIPDKLSELLASEVAFEEALQSRDPAAKAAGKETI